jgi:hypothetical protein
MSICRKCNKSIPRKIVIEGKERNLQRRKYCLVCSPFGLHNTVPIHRRENIDKNKGRTCSLCKRKYNYIREKGHTKSKCNSCMVNTRRFEKKIKAQKYLGGKCRICGYNKCSEALDFHHLDPSTKLFEISGSHSRKWSVLQTELDKCVLICCRCHREIHAGITVCPSIHSLL